MVNIGEKLQLQLKSLSRSRDPHNHKVERKKNSRKSSKFYYSTIILVKLINRYIYFLVHKIIKLNSELN